MRVFSHVREKFLNKKRFLDTKKIWSYNFNIIFDYDTIIAVKHNKNYKKIQNLKMDQKIIFSKYSFILFSKKV